MKRVVRLITQQARASVVRRNASTKVFPPLDTFVRRHIDTNEQAINSMLQVVGVQTVDELIDKTVPSSIRAAPLPLPNELKGEQQVLSELQKIAKKNKVYKSYIGMGYNGTILPPVIQRNILENPGWYTQYTPYQAEISQGRLESLLNFQTMIQDLTGLPIANASLLDEATAAAEAMNLCFNGAKSEVAAFFVSQDCHPQTIALIKTRAEPLNITVHVGNHETFDFTANPVCGAMIQYPTTTGTVHDYKKFVDRVHASGALVVCAADILSLALLTPPGEFGVDIALGSSQRFGVPMGYGGPHAAYLAVKDAFKRVIPGRIIGVSKDAHGNQAYRMALQTREQHIRREKATSNICTAQALLANISAMYAVYHGPEGVKRIAADVHKKALVIAEAARRLGHTVGNEVIFDTVKIQLNASVSAQQMADFAVANEINIRTFSSDSITISVDEATTEEDIVNLINVIAMGKNTGFTLQELAAAPSPANSIAASSLARTSAYLTHPIFNMYHTEHELLRYLHRLQTKDLSLTTSMIALGSCTMKLNATVEMMPITWPEFANIHPFVPKDQATGYLEMFKTLEEQLCAITGFHAMTLQPNAGSQGEYAGLLVIRKYLASIGQGHRNICLIPVSAHGTNPASAVMAGMKVVTVECNADGDISMTDLKAKAEKYSDKLAAVMVTYPSTHGVFEETIREVCEIIHKNGGQVYMDGANMNAQVGLTSPGFIGADVCHLNLHKTFCIPHGGGGPGMGPIGVAKHLAPFLPSHPVVSTGGSDPIGPISAAPWGSSLILTIPYVYLQLMGGQGLTLATKTAILNANYMAARLRNHYKVLFTGTNGFAAHEFIIDLRPFKAVGIEAEDIAKRLMDFNFHAPTMSFPIPGTLMIEPTESETKAELDRFCEAMIAIRREIQDVEDKKINVKDSPLKHAPHTAAAVCSDTWDRVYSRDQAAFPAPWVRQSKFWPAVGRVDNVYGDKNLMCSCPPLDSYSDE